MEDIEAGGKKTKIRRVYPSTVICTSMVLLMIGLVALIGLHAYSLSNYIKENIVLSVFMSEDASEQDVLKFQKEIAAHPYLKHSVYVSKDSAAKALAKDLPGQDFIRILGYNPLTSSIDVYLKPNYAFADSITLIKAQLLQNSLVKEINFQQPLVESVNANIRTVELILIVFSAILLSVAVSLIYVTIRLAIYSRRFLIRSMQLVGATRGFIRRPFLAIGALNGLLAGILATVLLYGLLYVGQREIPGLADLRDNEKFTYVFGGVIVLGIILSFISTFFAVSKHLRTTDHRIYH